MSQIDITVRNQKLRVVSFNSEIISGTQEFVQFHFDLDSGWDDLVTFAQFGQGGDYYNVYLDGDNNAFLPQEIGAGKCTLMLYGSLSTTIATTNYLTLTIDQDIFVSDASSTDITESLYNQMVDMVTAATQAVADVGSSVANLNLLFDENVNSWVAAYNVISKIPAGGSAFFLAHASAATVLSDGNLNIAIKGMINRAANGVYDIIAYTGYQPQFIWIWRISSFSSASVTPTVGAISKYEALPSPATNIVLASTDTTWEDIFPKLAQITTSRTATVNIHANAMSVLSDGNLTGAYSGVVCRTTTGTFSFMLYPLLANISLICTFRITNASTTGATMGTICYYTPGDSGTSGISPTVTIEEIIGGHRITITDVNGAHSFDVFDGQSGGLDAGDIAYNDEETYSVGTVGAELGDVNYNIARLNEEAFDFKQVEYEQGYWAIANGSASSGSAWIRTTNYLPSNTSQLSIDTATNIVAFVLAYESGVYIGYWNGTAWTKTYNANDGKQYYDISSLRTAYPTYAFKLSVHRTNSGAISPSDASEITAVLDYPEIATKDDLKDLYDSTTQSFEFENGGLAQGDGSGYSTTARIRTVGFTLLKAGTIFHLSNRLYKYKVHLYWGDIYSAYESDTGFLTEDYTLDSDCFVRFDMAFVAGGDVNVNNTDGNSVVEVRLDEAKSDVKLASMEAKAGESLKLMTFNVQRFGGLNADTEMQEVIVEKNNPAIICFQEFSETIGGDSIYTELYKDYPYHFISSVIPTPVGFASKKRLFGATSALYAFQSEDDPDAALYKEKRGYAKAYFYHDGRKICLITTHLDLNPTTRIRQLDELLSLMEDEDYCIACGDLNVDNITDFQAAWGTQIKPFVDADYHVTNLGYEYGINWTASNSTDGLTQRFCIDTIITTGNIDPVSMSIDKTKLEYLDGVNPVDHLPVASSMFIK